MKLNVAVDGSDFVDVQRLGGDVERVEATFDTGAPEQSFPSQPEATAATPDELDHLGRVPICVMCFSSGRCSRASRSKV